MRGDKYIKANNLNGEQQALDLTEDTKIPLRMLECMMAFTVQPPTSKEASTLPIYDITKDEVLDARKFVDDPAEIFFDAEEPKGKLACLL